MSAIPRTPHAEERTVVEAASRLNVSEFEFFRIAYENWFGRSAPDGEVEDCFDLYLARSTVPMWVRAFVREICGLHEAGRLDPRRFGISARPPTNGRLLCVGGMTFAAMIFVVALLIYLAQRSADSSTAGCFFPPCY